MPPRSRDLVDDMNRQSNSDGEPEMNGVYSLLFMLTVDLFHNYAPKTLSMGS